MASQWLHISLVHNQAWVWSKLGGSPTTTNNNSCHMAVGRRLGTEPTKLTYLSAFPFSSCGDAPLNPWFLAWLQLRSSFGHEISQILQKCPKKFPWVSPTVEPWRPSWKVLAGFSRFGFWEKRLKHVVKYRHLGGSSFNFDGDKGISGEFLS